MFRSRAIAALVLSLGGGAAVAAAEDLLVRTRVTIDGVPRAVEEVYQFTDGKKVVEGERLRSIIDYQRRTVLTLDKHDKTYRTATLDEIRRSMDEMTAFMRRGLRGLPHDGRVGMGQAGFDPRPRFTLRPSGKTDHVAGFLVHELVLEGGPVRGSIWVAPALRRPPEDREWACFTERFGGLQMEGSKLASAMARLRGWPARTELIAPGDVAVKSEVVEVRTQAPAAEMLRVPEGYKPVEAQAPRG